MLIAVNFVAASAQVSNGGFENWTTSSGISNPNGWITSNSTASPGLVTASTPGHSGTKACRLLGLGGAALPGGILQDVNISSTAIATDLTYWVKGSLGATDSLFALAYVLAADSSLISIAGTYFTGSEITSNWQQQSNTFLTIGTGTPAILEVSFFLLGGSVGSTSQIDLDDVSISVAASVADYASAAGDFIQNLYQSGTDLILNTNASYGEMMNINVRNLAGQLVMNRQMAGSSRETLNVAELPSGIYLVEVRQGSKAAMRKILIGQ